MKRFILSLFVGFLGIISFCSAQNIMLDEVYSDTLDLYNSNFRHTYYNINENSEYDLVCYRNISPSCSRDDIFWNFYSAGDPGDFGNSALDGLAGGGLGVCTTDGQSWISVNSSKHCVLEIKGYVFSGFNSEFCQSEFNLIPEEDINNLYCEEHGYCPSINTGDIIGPGDIWSALFINEIQHPSAPLINITIPEEFDWTYTGDDEEYDVVVNGYNVNTEYIDGIIRNQTTLPNDIDFNNTLSGLVPLLIPGLVIIMFLYFVFKSIKKIF